MNRYIVSYNPINSQTPTTKVFHEIYGVNAKAAKTLFEIQHPEFKVDHVYPTQNSAK